MTRVVLAALLVAALLVGVTALDIADMAREIP